MTSSCSAAKVELGSTFFFTGLPCVLLPEPYLCRQSSALTEVNEKQCKPFTICDAAEFCVMYVETDPPFNSVASPLNV